MILTFFDFRPGYECKIEFKDIFVKSFFSFLEPLRVSLASKLAKRADMTSTKYFSQIIKYENVFYKSLFKT
jgi:hypothetical protein